MDEIVRFDRNDSWGDLAFYAILNIIGSGLLAVLIYLILRVFIDATVSWTISLAIVIIMIPLGLSLIRGNIGKTRYGLKSTGLYIYRNSKPMLKIPMDNITEVILTNGRFRFSSLFDNGPAHANIIIKQKTGKKFYLALKNRDDFVSLLNELSPNIPIKNE